MRSSTQNTPHTGVHAVSSSHGGAGAGNSTIFNMSNSVKQPNRVNPVGTHQTYSNTSGGGHTMKNNLLMANSTSQSNAQRTKKDQSVKNQ